MNWKIYIIGLLALATGLTQPAFSQDKDVEKIETYFKMDLDQLLTLEMTTAGKKREKISDIPASVVLLTREEIETYGYRTLVEILENIPGVYLIDDYMHKNVGIRGFWDFTPNRNVIIMVNNIPYREEILTAYYLENINIPVEAIDKIEVIRGPMSVIYGNGGFFGAINIITNEAEEDGRNNIAAVSLGSRNMRKLFARGSGKNGDFQYVVNGSYTRTDGPDIPLEEIGGPAFTGQTTGDKLGSKEKFFNFSGTFNQLSFNMSYTENHKELMVLLPPVGDGTLVFFKDLRLSLGYKKRFSDVFKMEAKLSYFSNRHTWEYDMLFPDFYGYNFNGSSGYRGELNLFVTPNSRTDITVGLNYFRVLEAFNDYTLPFFGLNLIHHNLAEGESIITQSLFAQVDYTLSDKLKIVAGAMLEQMPEFVLEQRLGNFETGGSVTTQATLSYTGVEFIPRLALIYSPNKRNIFKFLYGKALNRPSLIHDLDLVTTPGASALEPETLRTLELNYIGQLSSKLTVNLSVFRNMLDKLIYRSFFSVGDTAYFYYANVGEMVTNGMELTVMSSPTRSLYIELSGTYQDTKDQRPGFEDIESAYSPKFLGYLKASYFFNKDISLAITGNYVDSMETYWDTTLPVAGRLGRRVEGYFLLGGNLRIRNVLGTGLFLNFRVSNLLDKEIRYPATANNFQFASLGTIGESRAFLVTLGWKF